VDAANGSSGNRISGNSIHDNGGLGIDLGDDSVTNNVACGGGQEPNLLQNLPVLTSAVRSGAGTRFRGTLNAAPNSAFVLEFFSSSSCDPSGYGEGERFLGSARVATDASCNGAST
jgi:parallel beta-helix repeat protein